MDPKTQLVQLEETDTRVQRQDQPEHVAAGGAIQMELQKKEKQGSER